MFVDKHSESTEYVKNSQSSTFYNIKARHEQHERDKSATQVWHKQHTCEASATQTTKRDTSEKF